jgi:hypothetical protein
MNPLFPFHARFGGRAITRCRHDVLKNLEARNRCEGRERSIGKVLGTSSRQEIIAPWRNYDVKAALTDCVGETVRDNAGGACQRTNGTGRIRA